MTATLDIVVCSLEDWDFVWRRNQYLVAGLLTSDPRLRVLFVEPPADPIHAVRSRRTPRPGRGLRPVNDVPGVGPGRLWRLQPTKWLPRRLGGDVDLRIAQTVESVARNLSFHRPLLWVNDPSAAATMHATGWQSLYDITDDWLLAPRTDRQRTKLINDEDCLMAGCAEVVVCSPQLVSSKSASRRVTLIRNAVDVARFRSPRPRPTLLPGGPQAVYVGTIHRDRIDVELLASTAEAVRAGGKGGVTLVGPDAISEADRRTLTSAGIHLLGARPHHEIPGYLQHAQVLMVPHAVNAFTDSLDPIKLYEYLAVGRPIVSTPVAGFRDVASDVALIASGAGFVDAVRSRLAATPVAPGVIASVDVPSWDDRVSEMRAVLDRLADATQS